MAIRTRGYILGTRERLRDMGKMKYNRIATATAPGAAGAVMVSHSLPMHCGERSRNGLRKAFFQTSCCKRLLWKPTHVVLAHVRRSPQLWERAGEEVRFMDAGAAKRSAWAPQRRSMHLIQSPRFAKPQPLQCQGTRCKRLAPSVFRCGH